MHPIERVTSREVYRNQWMTVREDDIRRPDGSAGIYGVIDKPHYALVVARDHTADEGGSAGEARYCLVQQFRYPIGLRRWEFPQGTAAGGAIDDQPEPATLAADELREETGLRAGSLVVLGQLDVAPGMSSQRGWVWLATELTQGEHEREIEEQDMQTGWFTASDVEAMMRSGEVTDAQSIAAWTLLRLSGR